jgi:hypothetical protein
MLVISTKQVGVLESGGFEMLALDSLRAAWDYLASLCISRMFDSLALRNVRVY